MDYFTHLLLVVKDFSLLGYLIIAAFSFFESLAFIGLIVPGSVTVVIGGFLVAQGFMNIGELFIFASLGAILGDSFSFYLGKKGIISFREGNKIFKPSLLAKGENYFRKHGSKSVFLGRFIGWIRPIVPFIAGVFKLDRKTFLFWNILSAFLWAAIHIAIGLFFGQALDTIKLWSTRGFIFITVFSILIFIFYILKWIIIKNSKRILYIIFSISHSIKKAFASNSDIQKFMSKHALFTNFIRKRLDKDRFWGLPWTLLSIGFIYTLFLFVGIIEDIITSDTIVFIDMRVTNLLVIFRNVDLTQFFLWVTLLGKWQVVLIFTAITVGILWIWNKKTYIIPLLIVISGSEIFTILSKIAFHRSRPEFAVYVENSFSFPSGHATIAIAFYGFLAYMLIHSFGRWKTKVSIFIIWLIVILLIGFSRLYLGVHYLSDVWGGFLVGALWLIIGISISEWLHSIKKNDTVFLPQKGLRTISAILILFAFSFYTVFAINYHPQISQPVIQQKEIIAQSIDDIFLNEELKYTETITGNRQEPIGFIIFAKNDKKLIKSLEQSGWYLSDKVGIKSLVKTAEAVLFKQQYLRAPMTPSFWNKQVHNFGFEKPTKLNNVRQRHHARFWKTNYINTNGKKIYIGAASFDSGMKWGITHKIDPDIDTEQKFFINDMKNVNIQADFKKQKFVSPVLGKNFSGDQFFTDGEVYIISIK